MPVGHGLASRACGPSCAERRRAQAPALPVVHAVRTRAREQRRLPLTVHALIVPLIIGPGFRSAPLTVELRYRFAAPRRLDPLRTWPPHPHWRIPSAGAEPAGAGQATVSS
ncbi:hypothetical protein [Nocardia cyriacigeorgica]|uniref:hypothetical protein n=1 Tax=Nocardia cyriacigeorgica TaxID=135487 RepID=UPI002456ACEB|nr:hypothetical protein [Nocardia cyriacigeorgica]